MFYWWFHISSHTICFLFSGQFTKGLQETDANGSSRPRSRRQEPAGRHRPITTQDDHPDPPTLARDPMKPVRVRGMRGLRRGPGDYVAMETERAAEENIKMDGKSEKNWLMDSLTRLTETVSFLFSLKRSSLPCFFPAAVTFWSIFFLFCFFVLFFFFLHYFCFCIQRSARLSHHLSSKNKKIKNHPLLLFNLWRKCIKQRRQRLVCRTAQDIFLASRRTKTRHMDKRLTLIYAGRNNWNWRARMRRIMKMISQCCCLNMLLYH